MWVFGVCCEVEEVGTRLGVVGAWISRLFCVAGGVWLKEVYLAVVLVLVCGCVGDAGASFAGFNSSIVLEVLGAGESASNPTFGAWAWVNVMCGGECPAWARVDRLDGVRDTTPFVRVIDESVSFRDAPVFPTWLQPNRGPSKLWFGGSVDNKPITYSATGFSARYNGTQLTPPSPNTTLFFSVAYENATFSLQAQETSTPGLIQLSIQPQKDLQHKTEGEGGGEVRTRRESGDIKTRVSRDTTPTSTPPSPTPPTSTPTPLSPPLSSFDQVRFDQFKQVLPVTNPPSFESSFSFHQESRTGALRVAFGGSGIFYFGATPSLHGRAAKCTAGGEYDATPSTHPLAVMVPGPDGKVAGTLPPNFQGKVMRLKPLPSPHRFCIIHQNITLFPSFKLFLPLCPNISTEIPTMPRFASIVAPRLLSISPQNNLSSSYPAVVNETQDVGGGLVRTTLQYTHRWATYNNYVPFYIDFSTPSPASTTLYVLLHDTLEEVHAPFSSIPWQTLSATLTPRPNLHTPASLLTSITWSDASLLSNATQPTTSPPSLYRSLGFNVWPQVSVQSVLAPNSHAPPFEEKVRWKGNRTGPEWEGLRYGPELSGFRNVFGTMLKTAPNVTVLRDLGVPPQDIALELAKWEDAVQFHNSTGEVDVAYDGVFFRIDVQQYCNASIATAADFIFADDEGYEEGFKQFLGNVNQSRNALRRRLPNESLFDLAWRMARELFSDWTTCFHHSPTTLAFYATPFPPLLLNLSNVITQPSTYGPLHYPHAIADQIMGVKTQLPLSAPLVPWLTACTYGQMTAQETLAGTLLTFAAGATGFSFFIDSCLDDGAKLLALSSATALFSPYADTLLQGTPISNLQFQPPNDTSNIQGWTGILHHQNPQQQTAILAIVANTTLNLTLLLPAASKPRTLCNLYTGTQQPITDPIPPSQAITFPIPTPPTPTLPSLFALSTSHTCSPPPPNTWIPEEEE